MLQAREPTSVVLLLLMVVSQVPLALGGHATLGLVHGVALHRSRRVASIAVKIL